MLRLRKNLQPRISNHLAALSAVLLMVSSFAGTRDALPIENQLSMLTEITQSNSVENTIGVNAQQAKKLAARKAADISLMIFRNN
jgi:hypothetical protein